MRCFLPLYQPDQRQITPSSQGVFCLSFCCSPRLVSWVLAVDLLAMHKLIGILLHDMPPLLVPCLSSPHLWYPQSLPFSSCVHDFHPLLRCSYPVLWLHILPKCLRPLFSAQVPLPSVDGHIGTFNCGFLWGEGPGVWDGENTFFTLLIPYYLNISRFCGLPSMKVSVMYQLG